MRRLQAPVAWTVAAVAVIAAAAVTARSQQPGRSFLNLDGPKPPGYTHVVTTSPGRMVFISGQGGRGADGTMPADFAKQAENTFRNIGLCLEKAGAKFSDIVKVNYYVTDLAHTEELRRVRARFLDMGSPPASTLVQVGLGGGMLLEVEAIAVIGDRR